ncbi:hypothetical protein ACFWII_39020 [Streptomyces sp. NPDC127063]
MIYVAVGARLNDQERELADTALHDFGVIAPAIDCPTVLAPSPRSW